MPGCRQLVLVVASDFKAKQGTLHRLVRDGGESPWREDGTPVACQLGRGGLGVGRGLWSALEGPAKRPGDGRTPAGLFTLPEAFGASEVQAAQAAGVRLPYQTVRDRLACVTDPETPLFGRLAGAEERAAAHVAEPFLLVVVGEVKTGKSSLLNALLGAEVSAVAPDPCTDTIRIIARDPAPAGTVACTQCERVRLDHPMAIVKAVLDSVGGTFADQWKELITADSFDEHTVVSPGILKTGSHGSTDWRT